MNERADAVHESATSEAVGTLALFLNVIALIAFSIFLGSFAVDDVALAAAAGFTAVAAFVISMACFVVESGRSQAEVSDASLPMG